MCGRCVLSTSTEELAVEFGLAGTSPPDPPVDYKIAPTKDVYAVLRASARTGTEPLRRLGALRCGDPVSAAVNDVRSNGPALLRTAPNASAEQPTFF